MFSLFKRKDTSNPSATDEFAQEQARHAERMQRIALAKDDCDQAHREAENLLGEYDAAMTDVVQQERNELEAITQKASLRGFSTEEDIQRALETRKLGEEAMDQIDVIYQARMQEIVDRFKAGQSR